MSPRNPLELVSFTGTGARVLTWGYVATMSILAAWSLPDVQTPWPSLAGIVVLVGVGVLLSVDDSTPLRASSAIIVAVAFPVVAAAISWHVLVPGGHAQWYYGAGTVALFLVSLRGHPIIAWIGFAAMSAVILAWSVTTGLGWGFGLIAVGKQLPILLVSVLFRVGVRRATRTITRLSEATAVKAAAEAAHAAGTETLETRLAELDAVATPLLRRLLDDAPLTDEDRTDLAVAEAALRDGLRGRSLAVPAVVSAADAARRRGVQVMLLDDRYPQSPDPETYDAVIEAVTTALATARDGRVVARLLPAGRDEIATVLAETSDGRDHLVIPAIASVND